MQKPSLKKTEHWDYFECEKYINQKLGYDIDDVYGVLGKEDRGGKPYLCFWDIISDICGGNGNQFYMLHPEEIREEEAWAKPILEAFWDEFGEGPYRASW